MHSTAKIYRHWWKYQYTKTPKILYSDMDIFYMRDKYFCQINITMLEFKRCVCKYLCIYIYKYRYNEWEMRLRV